MAEIAYTADLARDIKELQRVVRDLATASRATNTSIRNGTFSILDSDRDVRAALGVLPDDRIGQAFYDASGNELIRVGEQADGRFAQDVRDAAGNTRVQLGQLSDWGNGTGDFGIAVLTPDGRPLLLVDQDAQHIPWSTLVFVPWVEVAAGGLCWLDTATFVDFMAATQLCTAPFFHWNVLGECAAMATSMQWQIAATIAGSPGWVTIASGSSTSSTNSAGSVDLRPLLGSDIVGQNIDYRLQARRTGGSGIVGVRFNFPPVLRPN